jgi:hypothetical protein
LTASIPERRHDRLLSRVRGLQRSIAGVYRAALDDLVAQISRSVPVSGGVVGVGTEIVRRRLTEARNRTRAMMRQGFRDLVEEGHGAGIAVAEARIAGRRQRREWKTEDRSGVFQAAPQNDPLAIFQGIVGDIERGAGRVAQVLDPIDTARAAGPVVRDVIASSIRMPAQAVQSILSSRNAWGRTWEQQLDKSSERTSAGLAIAVVLANAATETGSAMGSSAEDALGSITNQVQPHVERVSSSMQLVAQAEGMRLGQRGQRWVYDRLETAGLVVGYTLHCACIPTSAPDHVARHLKFYETIEPGLYVAADGERMPEPPYGHPNCLCWITPELS